MLFYVVYVGEGGIASTGSLPPKTYSYKFDSKLPLNEHLINIYKSLKTIGVEVEHQVEDYEMRVTPANVEMIEGIHPFPLTLSEEEINEELLLLLEWQKKYKNQEFLLQFILKVELRVSTCIQNLKNENKIKATVFYLRKQLKVFFLFK